MASISPKLSSPIAAIASLSTALFLTLLVVSLKWSALLGDALISLGVALTTSLALRWSIGARNRSSANHAAAWTLVGITGASFLRMVVGGPPPDRDLFLVSTLFWGFAVTLAWWVAHGGDPVELISNFGQARNNGGKGPIGAYIPRPEAFSDKKRRLSDYQGAIECPECGSLQTGPEKVDKKKRRPLTLSCGACEHEWPCP